MTINTLAKNWTGIIPDTQMGKFIDRIEFAVKLYKDTIEPAQVSKELRKIERACKKPYKKLLPALASITSGTLEVIERDGKLDIPNNPADQHAVNKCAKDIQQRIISGVVPQKDRLQQKVVGSRDFKRPRKLKREVLTSTVISAYVGATGNTYRRYHDGEKPGPVYEILEDVLIHVGEIDQSQAGHEPQAVDSAIRRHLKSLNDPNTIRDILGK